MLIRLKFKIEELIREILDQFPDWIWKSSSTTFLDPAMGGGQFVAEIERRLRAAGHSEENIKSRVFGFESNRLRVNYAINMHKLIGQFKVMNAEDFFAWNQMKKFDVVVGNPPYQLTNSKKLWPEFTQKSLELTEDGGYTALIIPSSWLTSNSSSFKKVRDSLTGVNNLKKISRDANQHFDVGQDILYFISVKEHYTSKTEYVKDGCSEIIDLNNGIPQTDQEEFISRIVSKVIESKDKRIPFVFSDSLSASEVSKDQTTTHTYRCFYSTANIGYISSPLTGHGSLKIGVNFSSSYYSEKAEDNNMPITTDSVGGLMVFYPISTEEEGKLIRKYLSSKLFRFFVGNYKKKNTGFSDAVKRRMIPLLEAKEWSDAEIYNHFNLTQEEIDYIEATIK